MYKWTRSTSVNNAQTRNKLQTNTTRYDTTASNWWRRDCIYHSWTIIEWMLVTHEWLWSLTMTHGHSDRGHSDRGVTHRPWVTHSDRGSLWVTTVTVTVVTHNDHGHSQRPWPHLSKLYYLRQRGYVFTSAGSFVRFLTGLSADNSKSCVWNFEMM